MELAGLKENSQDVENKSGQKPKNEPPKEVTITDPKIIEDMWKDWLPGYYLMKGGSSYETGPAFGGNQKYSQFDPDKGGWVIYSNDEGIVYSYIEDKYGKWSLNTADDYMKHTCTHINEDGASESYNW